MIISFLADFKGLSLPPVLSILTERKEPVCLRRTEVGLLASAKSATSAT